MKEYKTIKFGESGDSQMFCATCKKTTWHRYRPSPDAGPFWRCSVCGSCHAEPDHG